GTPTIGGIVAGNISGPRRVSVGACRDFLLGVRYADGNGQIVKNGGRVMKNVTGYDLVKLMAGSFGTLGVLSEVALKVLPKTEMNAVLKLAGLKDEDAIFAMSRALASPFEVTGAAHAPVGPSGTPTTFIRIEGFESSVKYRVGRLTELLGGFAKVTVEYDQKLTNQCWKWIRDVEGFKSLDGDVWRLSVTASRAPVIAKNLHATGLLYDWGGGLIWALMPPGTDLRARIGKFAGHATLIRAAEDTRSRLSVFQPEIGPVAAITAGLRAKFDPRGIFNVGLMG
ncbi:MAG: FAD-binding protein, partial [Paracoccaceae bacterium]